ncbi:hypothetical protein WA026_000567 [Henosepilachna vigintioctopunctata]
MDDLTVTGKFEVDSKFEMKGVFKGEISGNDLSLLAFQAESAVRKIIDVGWSVRHFQNLPNWLQDNDYLLFGHRPPLPSFDACFKSIFRLHTETINIWTHLLGCMIFIGIATYFHFWPHLEIETEEKMVFTIFFLGAIACLGFSTIFHTLNCHSETMGSILVKLDYCGIVFLIVGSYVPWLYFVFYCHFRARMVYLTMMCILGLTSITISLWDKFSENSWKPYRAGIFSTFALTGLIPAIHFGLTEGWLNVFLHKSLLWLLLSGVCYCTGTVLYALRIPERFFPGKFDIWLHSHQLFHMFVIGGALVHYFGISEIAVHRLVLEQCSAVYE